MAYNKSKYVEAAQKLLNQGKVAQAIAEYQQILKYEPRDQVTLMTIGELYIRQGETFQAIEYFERLAQLFVSDGFLTKAIAVYKRISKLAPEEVRPLEKLADLYVQQGVMSEARPLFLQLAELHLKNGKQPEAIALLKKLLLAEPDNLRIQIRLADLYQAMGQSAEALEGYVSAAQRALARGDQAECERLADRALQINAKSLDALIVKAQLFIGWQYYEGVGNPGAGAGPRQRRRTGRIVAGPLPESLQMGRSLGAGLADFRPRRKEFHGHAKGDRGFPGIRAGRARDEPALAHSHSDDRCRRA